MNRCLWSHENCVGTVVLFAVGWRGIQRERALSASDSCTVSAIFLTLFFHEFLQ